MKTIHRTLVRAALAALMLVTTIHMAPAQAASSHTQSRTVVSSEGHGSRKEMAKPATGTATIGDLVIDGAWTRQAPPSATVVGGYARITNNGSASDRLIAASADFAERTEVHEMSVTDGVMTMNAVAGGLEIAPGATVELKPSSFHLMFMDATSPKKGETVPVTFVFELAGAVVVQMPVAGIGAGAAPNMNNETMDHGSMDHGSMKEGHKHSD